MERGVTRESYEYQFLALLSKAIVKRAESKNKNEKEAKSA